MPNDMGELRSIMFDMLRELKSSDKPNIERARAIRDLCGTVLDSAKVEVEMIRVTGKVSAAPFVQIENKPAPKIPDVKKEPEKLSDVVASVDQARGTTTTISILGEGIRKTVHKAA